MFLIVANLIVFFTDAPTGLQLDRVGWCDSMKETIKQIVLSLKRWILTVILFGSGAILIDDIVFEK